MKLRAIFYACTALCVALFAVTLWLVFYGTPLDEVLHFSQKIFYYHVPNAFMLFVAVIVCGVYSVLFLKKHDGRYDDVAEAAGELAVLFGAIVLVTGSIWGRAAWGVWWTWDARLTTSLLLWMVMLGYVLVRKYGGPGSERLAAGLAVFGMADVPLIYFSVKIWRTLHPKTSTVPTLDPRMRSAFWLSVVLFTLVFIILLMTRTAQARARRQLRETRELGLDKGLFE
jgi:heme exporter protein C